MSSTLSLKDAPANLSLREKLEWLKKAKTAGEQEPTLPEHATETVFNAAPVPEVAVAPSAELTPAQKAAAMVLANRKAAAVGVAPAIGGSVLPQISALEAAAKKVQNKAATGEYAFPASSVEGVKALELDPTLIEEKLQHWDLAIETKNPEAKTLLNEINTLLRTYDELPYLLSEEQIAVIVSGSLALAGTEVATLNATKSKAATRATNASMSASDF